MVHEKLKQMQIGLMSMAALKKFLQQRNLVSCNSNDLISNLPFPRALRKGCEKVAALGKTEEGNSTVEAVLVGLRSSKLVAAKCNVGERGARLLSLEKELVSKTDDDIEEVAAGASAPERKEGEEEADWELERRPEGSVHDAK